MTPQYPARPPLPETDGWRSTTTPCLPARSPWPPHCCVPAFVSRAIDALFGVEAASQDAARATFARLLGTKVSPEVPNPWELPVATDPEECGVGERTALERIAAAASSLGVDGAVHLDIKSFRSIDFELYEAAIAEKASRGAIVGIGFDYGFMAQRAGGSLPLRRAHHLVRLSPLASDCVTAPTIYSESFDFGYRGDLQTFDDSGELTGEETVMRWQTLIDGVRRADGAIWAVERVAS